jgi:hypothetical protein
MPARALVAILSALGVATTAFAAYHSPFRSELSGLNIGNAHLVLKKRGTLLRGSAPATADAAKLVSYGVTDVLIFKNETSSEVRSEISALISAGIEEDRITAIPFRWNEIGSFREACEQTVEALQKAQEVASSRGRTMYFHCTMGEDRTGYLAGLLRMLEQGQSLRTVFEEDLCQHGYEAGNPHKPAGVVRTVRTELTPVFLKMAFLIETGLLTPEHLDPSVCGQDPARLDGFAKSPYSRPGAFACNASPLAN